jgi:hypothetical protein
MPAVRQHQVVIIGEHHAGIPLGGRSRRQDAGSHSAVCACGGTTATGSVWAGKYSQFRIQHGTPRHEADPISHIGRLLYAPAYRGGPIPALFPERQAASARQRPSSSNQNAITPPMMAPPKYFRAQPKAYPTYDR